KFRKFSNAFLAIPALLCFSNIDAQNIHRSNVPAPAFEVTGSIYPWEVHDEGIDLILENMTSMAGINSVYMLAVMHQEHRPFNSDKLPGTFYFNHNPVRKEWDAEDAKAYFKPHLEMYGKIKPQLSSFSWLNDTDWLKMVLDKAHAKGLRAGAEVSHTYIPMSYLKQHPEIQQRDINGNLLEGNMNARPCSNNPDVREYLLALYSDIATNYDVDYIQTCMLLYSNQDEPIKGSTCFCTSCQKEAKEMGFDMAAAIPILRDNPNAQPQLDEWLNFRRASTTKIYKLVTDRIHQANPKIDFRLNDLNNRSSGLHLDELNDGHINSVHLSTHTEQNGYQKSDRASRIATTLYYAGKNVPIIAGVPTRLLTTPEIIKSSVKISVEGGAKGIGVKHYDGSPYSLLRALRNGISEAGVLNFSPVLGYEVENMSLSGYEQDKYLNEASVKTTAKGIATIPFNMASGVYDVVISYVDEKQGQGTIALFVGGKQKALWKLNEEIDTWRRKTITNIKIKKGEEIKIVGMADGSEAARLDFIEFIPRETVARSK
ncbi:MAG: beta-galactosidase, partial [Ginsengibacter sp.]